MKKQLKLFILSALVALIFALPQMHLSQAMEEKTPITFIQPDGTRMAMKVNLAQSLSDLRSELVSKGRMTPNDIFRQHLGDIFRDDETDWTIREIIINNTLSLKPRDIVAQQNIIGMSLAIPLVAQGHEAVYQRFLKGTLIYRPQEGSDVGMVTLPIAALANPLEGTFDLSRCGDTGQYLSISTGYRKRVNPENASKVEIWFTPRFLIEKELHTTAKHFESTMREWDKRAQVGIFWIWGGWKDLSLYDYLTTQNMDEISDNNLFEKWKNPTNRIRPPHPCVNPYASPSGDVYNPECFCVHFAEKIT